MKPRTSLICCSQTKTLSYLLYRHAVAQVYFKMELRQDKKIVCCEYISVFHSGAS